MAIKKNKNIIYTKCSEIPIHNFHTIRIDEDYRWLNVDYTGYNNIEAPKDSEKIFYELLNEYCELEGDRDVLDYYELVVEVSQLERRQVVVDALLETLCLADKKDYEKLITELSFWEMPFNIKNDFESEIKEMKRLQRGFNTKIERKRESVADFNVEGEQVTLIAQKVALEGVLGKNNIDIKLVSTEEWIELKKQSTRIYNAKLKWQKHS